MCDLSERDRQPELMDQPGLNPEQHEQALNGLRRVNYLSRTASNLFCQLRSLVERTGVTELRVLDIATGGGDVAIEIQSLANRWNLPFHVSGCDISSHAVEIAYSRARSAGLKNMEFFSHDVLRDTLPQRYDVVMCSLFLHHLDEGDTIKVLSSMNAAAKRMVLIDDLLRTRLGYALAWAGCRLLTRSTIVRIDGPLSVRGAYNEAELRRLVQQAGIQRADYFRHWPQRLTIKWTKADFTEDRRSGPM